MTLTWINAETKPEPGIPVIALMLFRNESHGVLIAEWVTEDTKDYGPENMIDEFAGDGWYSNTCEECCSGKWLVDEKVTHWMHLPEPPK